MEEGASKSKELRRPRLDMGKDIFSQLTAAFDDLATQGKVCANLEVKFLHNEIYLRLLHWTQNLMYR
jgi:ATP-dependent RNA circularization protein (DNA/RNA ligase family)